MVLIALLDEKSDTALLAGEDTNGLFYSVSDWTLIVCSEMPKTIASPVVSFPACCSGGFEINVPCWQPGPRSDAR